MATALEDAAIKAVDDPSFEMKPSYCQRFVREVVQKVFKGRFDKFHKDTAANSMLAWKSSPYAVPADHGSVPGDILYWGASQHQPEGHVAIRVTGNKVVENSVVHNDPHTGSKGYRPLSILRQPDLIVRLPKK